MNRENKPYQPYQKILMFILLEPGLIWEVMNHLFQCESRRHLLI